MDHIYIYISKVHQHGMSKIRNPSTIPAQSNVRVASMSKFFLRIKLPWMPIKKKIRKNVELFVEI